MVGLVRSEGEKYLPGSTQIHLPKDSVAIQQHHANWRQMALSRMDSDQAHEDLHYSSINSVSVDGARRIRALLTQAISDAIEIVKPSPEEQLVGINVDFFRVDG
jgi:hypothetical protein